MIHGIVDVIAIITSAKVDNGSHDAYGNKSLTLYKTTLTCADVGSNTVTPIRTYNNDNVSTCTATVTVQDNIPPTALCKNITVQVDLSGNEMITGADVDNGSNDACGIKSLALDKSSFTCADVGTNKVTLTVTDKDDNG